LRGRDTDPVEGDRQAGGRQRPAAKPRPQAADDPGKGRVAHLERSGLGELPRVDGPVPAAELEEDGDEDADGHSELDGEGERLLHASAGRRRARPYDTVR